MTEMFPRGYVIFADDIRHEAGNKPSFMGVYLDSMFVGASFPTAMQKLVVFVTYIDEIASPHGDAKISIFLPGDAEDAPAASFDFNVEDSIKTSSGKTATGKDATKMVFRVAAQIIPFPIKEAGIIRVVATFNGGELELGKLDIAEQPVEQASPVAADGMVSQ